MTTLRVRARCAGGGLLAACLFLAGCDSWFGDSAPARIPGERVAVLSAGQELAPDPEVATMPLRLPDQTFDGWPLDGGNARHDPQRLAGSGALNTAWTADIGSGSSSSSRLLVQPVVGDGRIYTLDTEGVVAALSASGGQVLWQVDVLPEEEDEGELGGGVAFAEGTLYVTTGAAEAMALEPANGALVWRVPLPGPSRSAPTVVGGRVFAVTADNRTVALDAATGDRLWSHSGASDEAGILGAASPAVDGSEVVVPYTSGEVYAMRVENGRVLWSDRLVAPRSTAAIARIAHIRARPIISAGRLYVVSHSGRTAAIDMRTGARVWQQNAGGGTSPWLAGEWLFLVTSDARALALSAADGRIRWATQLPAYGDPVDREDPIDWVGPVLVGDRLIVANSQGQVLALSPDSGEVVAQRDLTGAPIRIEPMAAGGTLYILDDNAILHALR